MCNMLLTWSKPPDLRWFSVLRSYNNLWVNLYSILLLLQDLMSFFSLFLISSVTFTGYCSSLYKFWNLTFSLLVVLMCNSWMCLSWIMWGCLAIYYSMVSSSSFLILSSLLNSFCWGILSLIPLKMSFLISSPARADSAAFFISLGLRKLSI